MAFLMVESDLRAMCFILMERKRDAWKDIETKGSCFLIAYLKVRSAVWCLFKRFMSDHNGVQSHAMTVFIIVFYKTCNYVDETSPHSAHKNTAQMLIKTPYTNLFLMIFMKV